MLFGIAIGLLISPFVILAIGIIGAHCSRFGPMPLPELRLFNPGNLRQAAENKENKL